MTGPLHLDFAGEEHTLDAGDDLAFGRGAELDIDDNPLLHRRFGHLYNRSGQWWLRNEGSRLVLHVHDAGSASSMSLAPGREVALTFASSAIRFEAGASKYEILVDLPGTEADPDPDPTPAPEGEIDATVDQSRVPILGGQRLLLVALCEPTLRDPHANTTIPTNKSIAHRFGWSKTTFNRRLDRLCAKFAAAGVPGLIGEAGDLARDRRQRLVDHAIQVGVVTLADLPLLDDHPVG